MSDDGEALWKTRIVTFMQLLGAPPSGDMVNWMTQVIQWPNNDGARAERAMAVLDSQLKSQEAMGGRKYSDADRVGFVNTNSNNELGVALAVIPVLAKFDPLPPLAMGALIKRMDDPSEPYGASAAILNLSQNPSINRVELANRLVTKALDTKLPVDIRAAAIHGIGFLGVSSARAKLSGLNRDPSPTIAGAAMDVEVYDNMPLQ